MAEIKDFKWAMVYEAIKKGKTDEALSLLDYGLNLLTMQNNSLASFTGSALNYIATFGEEHLEKLFRARYEPFAKDWINLTPKECADRLVSLMVNPHSKVTLTEEPDRYVVMMDPCRTGGRLRKGMFAGTAKLGAGIGTTKKAYPWSWNKTDVSYYCCHTGLFLQIIPIELRGYPIGCVQYAKTPEDPCVVYFYKKPELVPAESFKQVGKVKDPSRFKKK